MTKIKLNAGVCGMQTLFTVDTEDSGSVSVSCDSDCPHVTEAVGNLKSEELEPYSLCLVQNGISPLYGMLSPYIPHAACPCYCAAMKAIEAEAQLALKADVSISFVD